MCAKILEAKKSPLKSTVNWIDLPPGRYITNIILISEHRHNGANRLKIALCCNPQVMRIKHHTLTILAAVLLIPAVPNASYAISKKLKKANAKIAKLEVDQKTLQRQYSDCQDTAALYTAIIRGLREQLSEQKLNNTMLVTQLSDQKTINTQVLSHLKDLSVISGSQAESINKFLETMGAKDAYIKDLQSAMARKDSMNMALIMNLKGAVGDLNDRDINIKIDKGVVYIDISDKMLFKTGRYEITPRAKEVLGKVAKVLLSRPDIEFMVEGHTDNIPYNEGVLADNWDLSVKRATSVVRMLQRDYNIPPARMSAAGRSEYMPIADNMTEEGRAANRRTRIVILPQLDQFFKLLEQPKPKA